MGKGDRKSRKGKVFRKSYGISRPRKAKKAAGAAGAASSKKKTAAKKKKD